MVMRKNAGTGMNLECSIVTVGSEQVKTNGQIHTDAGV